ncbi:unnamed protein product [Peniophora sp. CBMAI 1063]|nr:unnamed protein product [Peniophora sp. CBMAI 1063]
MRPSLAAYHHPIHQSLYPPAAPPPYAGSSSKMFYSYVPNAVKTRKRTSAQQLAILEDVFVTDKKPNGPKRKELSGKLSMTPREVQVWFQNRRAKEKKQAAQRVGQEGEGSSTAPAAGADTSDGDSPSATPTDLECVPPTSAPPASAPPAIPQPPTLPPSLSLPSGPFPMRMSPPSAASAVHDQRRSSLPVTHLHSGQPAFLPPSDPALYRRASHTTLLDTHPCSPLARRASFDPRGPATRRFAPYGPTQVRPSLTHRPSAPEIYHHNLSYPPSHQSQPEYAAPQIPSPATPFEGWTNSDPFNQGAAAATQAPSFEGYEFPPKGPNQDPRNSVSSLASVPFSDTSTGPSTGGAYFSDASGPLTASDDGERRGSWAVLPHPPMLDRRASLGDPGAGGLYGHELHGHGNGRGSEISNTSGSGSENGTVYPSPPSDRARSASLPHTGGLPQPQQQQRQSPVYYGLPGANNSNGSGQFLPLNHSVGPSPPQDFNGYNQQHQPQQADFTSPQQPPQFFAPPSHPPTQQQQGFISPTVGYDSRRPSFDANASAAYDQRRPSYDANSVQPSFDRRPSYDANALSAQLPAPAYDQRRPSYDGSVGVNDMYDQRRPSFDANGLGATQVYDQRRPSMQSFDGSGSYEQLQQPPYQQPQYDAAHGHAGGPYDTAPQAFDGYGAPNGYQ